MAALVSGNSAINGFSLTVVGDTGESVIVGQSDPAPVAQGPDESSTQRLTRALNARGNPQGFITITSNIGLSVELKNSIEMLAAQVELALDREAMTEVIHKRRGEERFQTLVRNASDVIVIVRPDTTITYQTPSALKILATRPDHWMGESLPISSIPTM